MRSSVLTAALLGLVMAGCATRLPLLSRKPEPSAATATVPASAEDATAKPALWKRLPFLTPKTEAAASPALEAAPAAKRSAWARLPFLTPRAEPSAPATKPPPKPIKMDTRLSCPALKDDQWKPVMDRAIHKAFDRKLRKRYGDTAIQFRTGWDRDNQGNIVITAHRIGPVKFALPEPGKGGEIEVVFRACTGDVLKTRKLSDLERKPWPLETAAAPN